MLDRITIDPKVCHGQPCIRGMRMPIYVILDLLAAGMAREELLEAYPYLEAEDIKQCQEYASLLAREQTIKLEKAVVADEVLG
jgi:uncharacterized protein (DUF433 family)